MPKLCLYATHEPNFIKSFDKEKKLSFSYWTIGTLDWNEFKISRGRSYEHYSEWRRGVIWDIEEEWIDPEKDEEVLQENGGCISNYVTSYEWGCREQIVLLNDVGLTDEIMDKLQPPLEVSEWFCARWDCGSQFCIRVELLNVKKEVLKFFEHSERTDQWMGGELGWRKVKHVFCEYGVGVRYLRFADGGKDTQFWAGFYGSKMAAAWARVRFT